MQKYTRQCRECGEKPKLRYSEEELHGHAGDFGFMVRCGCGKKGPFRLNEVKAVIAWNDQQQGMDKAC